MPTLPAALCCGQFFVQTNFLENSGLGRIVPLTKHDSFQPLCNVSGLAAAD
jgi:hypothetical protein